MWSITKGPLLNKAQQKMSEKLKQAMDEQMKSSQKDRANNPTNSYYEGREKEKKSDILDAEYRVIKK